jgi:hypothetical protein
MTTLKFYSFIFLALSSMLENAVAAPENAGAQKQERRAQIFDHESISALIVHGKGHPIQERDFLAPQFFIFRGDIDYYTISQL